MSDRIYYKNINNIIHLVLNSPPKNEMTFDFFDILFSVITNIHTEKDIRGLIIYSNGRHFSSGANIDELYHIAKSNHYKGISKDEYFKRNMSVFRDLESLNYPKIAIIKGCCMGSGLELSLTCDYRFATKNAMLSLPESSFGFIPGCGGTIRLQRFVRLDKSIELILTGRAISSEEAKAIGLVDYIADKHTIIEDAVKFIDRTSFTLSNK